jgi:heme/copper-type cytochrome/quinol oxidase subunit 1
MHFLGLAGMPRRIPDYPLIYAGWNIVATIGSTISLSSMLLFILIVRNSLYGPILMSEREEFLKKIRLLRFLVLWILFENRNLLKLMFKVELDNVYADLNSCKLKKRYWKY